MFGRKNRLINYLRAEERRLLGRVTELTQQVVTKNQKMTEMADELSLAYGKYDEQAELIRGLNIRITELERLIEQERAAARKAEEAADAAIMAGGAMGDQLAAAQDLLKVKDEAIASLLRDADERAVAMQALREQVEHQRRMAAAAERADGAADTESPDAIADRIASREA